MASTLAETAFQDPRDISTGREFPSSHRLRYRSWFVRSFNFPALRRPCTMQAAIEVARWAAPLLRRQVDLPHNGSARTAFIRIIVEFVDVQMGRPGVAGNSIGVREPDTVS
jgi:hypothetical protein